MGAIGEAITRWFANIIGDLGDWLGDLDIGDILSGVAGIIPRCIVFFRMLLTPIYNFVSTHFGLIASGTLFAVIGFIIILGIRRGVFK